jgi:hypothetical protein
MKMTLASYWHQSALAQVLYPEGIPDTIPELSWSVDIRGHVDGRIVYETEMDECQALLFLELARNPRNQDMVELCRWSNCAGFLVDSERLIWLPVFLIAAEYAEQVVLKHQNALLDHFMELPYFYVVAVLPQLIRGRSLRIPYPALKIAYETIGLGEMSELEEEDLLKTYEGICLERGDLLT